MGVFHYKARLVGQKKGHVVYKYCPDFIEQKDSWGEFKVEIENWEPIIIKRAEPTGEIVVYIDERCVEALTHKIKKNFEENKQFPEEIIWIA